MSRKPTPKFMKPGDDPELDRLLEKARSEGSEPPGRFYYDIFGRRRRLALVDAGIDQDAPTNPGTPSAGKGVEIDRAALPSALMPSSPVASTGPMVTETPIGVPTPASMTQARVLRLATLAIGAPVLAMVIGAIWMNTRVFDAPAASTSGSALTSPSAPPSSAAPPSNAAGALMVEDAGTAPAVMTVPSIQLSATIRPTGSGSPRGARPGASDDPYADPPTNPLRPNTGSKIW